MDSRFDSSKDPRFKKLSFKKKKIILDDRFKSILTDPSFNTVVNPRTGRKEVSETSKRQLKNVYEKSDDENKPLKQDTFLKKTSVNKLTDANDHLSTEDTDSDVQSQFSWNENSSDSDTSSEETAIDNDSSGWVLEEENIPRDNKISARLAILGCDWNCVSSQDLYILLNNFAEKVGHVKRVAIYPSHFGKERLEDERLHGPRLDPNLLKASKLLHSSKKDADDSEDVFELDDEAKTNMANALRKYEQERSKYYFAVVECDNSTTADALYQKLEGTQADFAIDDLDIRFIPDDTPQFTDTYPYPPRCQATEDTTHRYEPKEIFVRGLKHSKPVLEWDETPAARTRALRKHFTSKELASLDLKEYLASSCSDVPDSCDDGDVVDDVFTSATSIHGIDLPKEIQCSTLKKKDTISVDPIEDYRRQLLGDINMASGTPQSVKDKVELLDDIELKVYDSPVKTHDDKSSTKTIGATPWEQYVEKRKKKSREGKHQFKTDNFVETQENDDLSDLFIKPRNKKFSFPLIDDTFETEKSEEGCMKAVKLNEKSKKKQKKLKKKSQHSESEAIIDIEKDERFRDILNLPSFAIDPTNPKFTMTKTYEKLIQSKLQRRKLQKTEN